MAHYLVTGGAGFIGTNLIKELVKQGHQVRSIDNYCAGRFLDRVVDTVEYVEGDIRNMADVKSAAEGVDGVFHAAAVPRVPYSVEHPQESNENNVIGTLNVLIAARDAKLKRLVFSTSSSIYGGSKNQEALQEDVKFTPKSPYALQKLVGQEYCRLFSELYNLETVSLCYFNIYGPQMDPNGAYALAIGKFLKQRSQGKPMTVCGDGEFYRDYTHVKDTVRANILAMESSQVGKGELINIGNNDPKSVNEIVKLIGGETRQIPERPGDVRYARADNTKAKELLGWEPSIEIAEGIKELKKNWNLK